MVKITKTKKPKKKGVAMEFLFVIILFVAAVGVQIMLGWLSKNEFTLQNFAMLVPFFIIAQYFISLGYHDGTQQTNFITAHIIWTAMLVGGTLIANYAIFQNVPTPLNLFALVLAGAAAVISVMGK